MTNQSKKCKYHVKNTLAPLCKVHTICVHTEENPSEFMLFDIEASKDYDWTPNDCVNVANEWAPVISRLGFSGKVTLYGISFPSITVSIS